MKGINKNIKPILDYSTVEFELSNTTNKSVNVDLFNSNNNVVVPEENPIGSFPNSLGRLLPPTGQNRAIAIDEKRNNLGVFDVGVGSFSIVNIKTGVLLSQQIGLTYGGVVKVIYVDVTDKYYAIKTGLILQLNSNTGEIEESISVGGASPNDIVFNPLNNNLYVTISSAKILAYVNINSFSLPNVNQINIPTLTGTPKKIILSTVNNVTYLLDDTDNKVWTINTSINILSGSITTGVGSPKLGIYVVNNQQVYYYDSSTGRIKFIDVNTNLVVGQTIVLSSDMADMTYSSDLNYLWLYVSSNNNISVLDAGANLVISTTPINPIYNGQIVYSGNFNSIYFTTNLSLVQEMVSNSSSFNISGSSNYNSFVRDNLVNPKKLDRVMIYAEDNQDLINAMGLIEEDASGESCSETKLPNTTVGTGQFQGQIGQLDLSNFILDVTTKINYTIPAFTKVTWVIYYKEYKRKDFLRGMTMIQEHDVRKPIDPDTYDEKHLIDTALTPNWMDMMETRNLINK